MSKKSYLLQAGELVPEYKILTEQFIRKYTIAGKSSSCIKNYLMQISKLVLHYQCSPLDLSIDQLEDYLFYLRQKDDSPSHSSFKHLVYGLRRFYEIFKKEDLRIALPSCKEAKTLPVVFSQREVVALLRSAKLLKHRLLFATIYDGGLRISELVNLAINDVDLDRRMLHIRQSKQMKDRYVPISEHLVRGLRTYLDASNPKVWLFNGRVRGEKISRAGVRHAFRASLKKANITKEACVHTLRHSYATHLLEMGLDIISVQHQLGHSTVSTTMMYLHIAQSNPKAGFSPMQELYNGRK